jgi:hypothetical protein
MPIQAMLTASLAGTFLKSEVSLEQYTSGGPPLSQSSMAALDIGNAISILAFVVIQVTAAAEIGN